MKKELLAPVGSSRALEYAVKNGADAVYLAGKNYGARKYADNFTNEELKDAVKYAHLYGVKVYVTVNTIIFQDEIKDCLKYIEYLNNIGVDALIVQDLGLIKLIREYFPEMDIHASTQAHTHNIEQIKILESLGVKRVVLARELSIDEINKLDTNMELEVFIHGALCVCYSGQCLFSSFLLNRSGNRGLCAGLCRIPYNLVTNNKVLIKDKYLISPKELNTTSYMEELKDSKVYSFKIEGRMKSPEYVGYVVSLYRKILDNDNYKLSKEEIFNLKSLYNRGFTKGYLFNELDKDFISLNSSNHLGVEIGEVIYFDKHKIKIKLSHELRQEDAIRLPNGEGMYVNFLYDVKGKLINKGDIGDIVLIDNKGLDCLGKVSLTINKKLDDELKQKENKKIDVKVFVYAHINEKLVVSYSDEINEVKYTGEVVDKANNAPISKERIREIFKSLGDTPFRVNEEFWDIEENIFVAVGVLKNIKRTLIEELVKKRTSVNRNVKIEYKEDKECKRSVKLKISALARSEEQVLCLLENKVDYIYVTDEDLYQKYRKYSNIYLRLDRVITKYKDYQNERLLIGETGSFKYTKDNVVVSDYYLNVVNSPYVNLLYNYGIKRVTISPECDINRLKSLVSKVDNKIELEIIGYGTLEYMIMKYNLGKDRNLRLDEEYFLENKNKQRFPLVSDKFTHLFANKRIDLIENIKEYQNMGINTFRLELFKETKEEIESILKRIKS